MSDLQVDIGPDLEGETECFRTRTQNVSNAINALNAPAILAGRVAYVCRLQK